MQTNLDCQHVLRAGGPTECSPSRKAGVNVYDSDRATEARKIRHAGRLRPAGAGHAAHGIASAHALGQDLSGLRPYLARRVLSRLAQEVLGV